jgi:hypothetical protein
VLDEELARVRRLRPGSRSGVCRCPPHDHAYAAAGLQPVDREADLRSRALLTHDAGGRHATGSSSPCHGWDGSAPLYCDVL